MSRGTYDSLAQARRLAGEHGFVIAEIPICTNPTAIIGRNYVRAYVLYRRRVRIGRRRDPAAIVRLLKKTLEADKVKRADQPPPLY